ncbi:hypothetical protein Tco_1192396 [Tanacetum coccineum]
MSSYNHFGCSWCGGPFNGGNCQGCSCVGSGNEFVYDPNPYSSNETPDFSYPPPQPQFETYSCELCGNDSHYGYDCPPRFPLVYEETPKVLLLAWEKFFKIKHREKQHPLEDIQELIRKLLKDVQNISEELAEYINSPSWNRPAFYFDDDDDEESSIPVREIISELPLCVAITPEEPDNSLSMGDEHLSTIPETESDEVIKSSVENLVPIPCESEDFSDIKSECDVPVCDNSITFSNPLFDADNDFSSSNDESFSDEDVLKEIYSNPLFDEEIISDKIDASITSSPKIDSFLEQFSDELAHIDLIPPGINEADFDPEEVIRLVERLLYDNSSPRPPKELNS